jgi:hypothetical protein
VSWSATGGGGDLVLVNADPVRLEALAGPTQSAPRRRAVAAVARERPGTTLKLNLALRELPRFTSMPEPRGSTTARSTCSPTWTTRSPRWTEALRRRSRVEVPDRPPIELYLHTAVDPSLRTRRATTRAPCSSSGSPTGPRGQLGRPRRPDRRPLLALVDEVAPGTSELVVDRQVLHPAAIEDRFGITGGHIFHLDNTRSFTDRLPYRTATEGLYACGAGCHPAGSVIGAAGWNAACVALADRGLDAPVVPGPDPPDVGHPCAHASTSVATRTTRSVLEGGWYRELELRDGSKVLLRQIRPEDRERLAEGLRRLSPASRFLRFQRVVEELTEEELTSSATSTTSTTRPSSPSTSPTWTGRASAWRATAASPSSPRSPRPPSPSPTSTRGREPGRCCSVRSRRGPATNGVRVFRNYVMDGNTAMLEVFDHLGATRELEDVRDVAGRPPAARRDEDLPDSPAGRAFLAAARGPSRLISLFPADLGTGEQPRRRLTDRDLRDGATTGSSRSRGSVRADA